MVAHITHKVHERQRVVAHISFREVEPADDWVQHRLGIFEPVLLRCELDVTCAGERHRVLAPLHSDAHHLIEDPKVVDLVMLGKVGVYKPVLPLFGICGYDVVIHVYKHMHSQALPLKEVPAGVHLGLLHAGHAHHELVLSLAPASTSLLEPIHALEQPYVHAR